MEKTIKLTVLVCVLTLAYLLCCLINFNIKDKSPTEIFTQSSTSVVELKAVSSDIGESFGTAVFIDDNDTLITNAHVVTYKKLDQVFLFDTIYIRSQLSDEYIEVELEKYDLNLDIAVLHLIENNFIYKPLQLGDSDSLKNGQKVYAVGNSLNYGISIAQGIVGIPIINIDYEGINRRVIQCDLNITEGNSGGALLNQKGNIIGITSFRIKNNAGQIVYGIAYCIPINTVLEYIKN